MFAAGLAHCATTFHSLVAAYVGFGDIPTAENIVQAMREGRADVCLLLRQVAAAAENNTPDEHSAVLEDVVGARPEDGTEAPLLPRTYPPNSRVYTTLMKGYMNAGRVDDVVAMARAMRLEGETMP
jgi:pentatricopeptide repeat protein